MHCIDIIAVGVLAYRHIGISYDTCRLLSSSSYAVIYSYAVISSCDTRGQGEW